MYENLVRPQVQYELHQITDLVMTLGSQEWFIIAADEYMPDAYVTIDKSFNGFFTANALQIICIIHFNRENPIPSIDKVSHEAVKSVYSSRYIINKVEVYNRLFVLAQIFLDF